MAAAQLTYSANPTRVAVRTGDATSFVGMTFTIVNGTPEPVELAQATITIPQGSADTDLLAPNTSFNLGSVQSSNGTSWSLGANGNQITLVPVTSQGYATLGQTDTLQFTLSQMQVNSAGAGKSALIQIAESIFDEGTGAATIKIDKLQPGFQIQAFYASAYNVNPGDPVTITWKVFQALSCEVTAEILDVASPGGAPAGNANPNCNGTLASGTDFSDSRTCNVIGATVFTLTARATSGGEGVALTSQLLVTVNSPAINFSLFPPVIDLGQTVGPSWIAANAAKLLLYIVPAAGPPPPPLDVTKTPIGNYVDTPKVNTTYTLYAFARATDTQPVRQQSQNVVVEPPAWVQNPTISNAPQPAYPGDTFTLNWQVVNVNYCDLTCDVTSFAPINNLPLQGPQPVTVPDPGVPQQTANFSLIPVMYGSLGDFTVQPFPLPIQNTPNFSKGLTSDVTNGGPGATINLTWAVNHTDGNGTLSSDFQGSTPLTVDPTSGAQAVQLPNVMIPTPITYQLLASRQSGKYTATSSTRVQMNGNVIAKWCIASCSRGPNADNLGDLYKRYPSQRITKIGVGFGGQDVGVYGIYLWYSSNSAPDYSALARLNSGGGPSQVLALAAGEYITSISTDFAIIFTDDEVTMACLWWVQFGTSAGRSIAVGGQDTGGDERYSQTADEAQQVIGLGWGTANNRGYIDAIGIYTCPTSYGA